MWAAFLLRTETGNSILNQGRSPAMERWLQRHEGLITFVTPPVATQLNC